MVLPDALLAPDPAKAAATVEWEPSRGVLGPGESVECMMRLDATRVGSTDLSLPCFVVDQRGGDPYESCRVVLNCETSGGRLRFAEPEVDLGLIAVGAKNRAAKESDIPNFKGSFLGRFPLVSADFWTSDHLAERSRSVDVFSVTRAR